MIKQCDGGKSDHLPRDGRPPGLLLVSLAGRAAGSARLPGEIPHYPGLNRDPLETFLPKVLTSHVFDHETALVGHSGGAALVLAILEHIETRVAQAILVAGYSTPPNTSDEPVLQATYDWDRIRTHVRDIAFINSIRDPYGCDAEQGRRLLERLGGTQIVRDEGHFGDGDDPYPRFELLEKLID